jgi:hypothetical protein
VHDPAFVALVAVIIVILIVRNVRPQKMNVTRLWLAPLVFVVLSAQIIFGSLEARVSAPLVIGATVLGAALGTPLGLLRGRSSTVRKTKDPKVLIVEPSVLTLILWVVAFGARAGLHYFFGGAGTVALAVGDGLLAFAVASVVASRYVVYTKFKALHAA